MLAFRNLSDRFPDKVRGTPPKLCAYALRKNEVRPKLWSKPHLTFLIFQTILLQQEIKQIQYQNSRFVIMRRSILYNNYLLK